MKTPIRLGSHAPIDGPLKIYSEHLLAMRAVFKRVNSQGGIGGRQIELIVENDSYDADLALAAVERLVKRDICAFVGCVGLPHAAALSAVQESGRPDVFVSSGARRIREPFRSWLFPFNVGYTEIGCAFGRHAGRTLKGRRLAVLFQDSEAGREFAAAFEANADGVQVVLRKGHAVGESLVDHLRMVQDQACDAIWIAALVEQVAEAMKQSRIRGLQWLTVFSDRLLDAAGAAADGAMTMHWHRIPDGQFDQVCREHERLMTAFDGPLRVSAVSVSGQLMGEMVVEALKRTKDNLDPAAIIRGLEALSGWTSPLSYSPCQLDDRNHVPFSFVQTLRASRGSWVAAEATAGP